MYQDHDGELPLPRQQNEPKYLTDYNKNDKPWDTHRATTQIVENIYQLASQPQDLFARYSKRISECSEHLAFGWSDDLATGESKLKLREARFCRVRHCPVCQWRRSLMWTARFFEALPSLEKKYPTHRFIFLTLTIRNCDISELRSTLARMHASWRKLISRKKLKVVDGWLRATEVTRGSDGSAHPHYHAILMVKPSYFRGQSYISQAEWTNLWRESLKIEYDPVVHVKAVKNVARGDLDGSEGKRTPLMAAALETLKYSVKPADLVTDPVWMLELTKQVHNLRFIASGGGLRDVLKETVESDEDLALRASDENSSPDDGQRTIFSYQKDEKRYKKTGYARVEPR